MKVGLSLVLYKEPQNRIASFLTNIISHIPQNTHLKILIFLNSIHDYDFPENVIVNTLNHNVGFGKGHNYNYDWFLKNKFDKVIFSNTDLKVEGNFKEFLSDESATISGPTVLNPDKTLQNVTRSLPTITDKVISFFGKYPYYITSPITKKRAVPSISGCFFLLNIDNYIKLDFDWLFDPSFFMYEEDTDLNRRLWERGLVVVDPSVNVVHYHAKSSSKRIKMFLIHLKSNLIYFKKWGLFDKEAIKSRKLIKEYES